ncbi:MAG: phosphatidylserine decarboxylase family protein [Desulfobulbus sp.]|jgi:phosphatidylserine decarboxylase|uniref:phosphatidylserine decarboxylase family protein n=1 Tax=Desulfobulbus sp. TaxID=895 RepID=UPI0028488184|nr:phosphatidylserine decarboxylase family protein [Desulfobulbus sp.]MDR2549444.1 phosphatidylserine decarboxylase family protein [Desulfobulbus sp.]
MQKPQLPMALEGYPFILFCAFATLVLAALGWAIPALAGLLLTGFVTYFFRDPARVLPEQSDAIVCPADGKVIVVAEVDDDRFLHARAQKISIFMNVFNVHVNRVPLTGTVERVTLSPGKFYSADKDKAVLHNEFCALTLATPHRQRYAVVQIAGLIARRIVCRAEAGDRVLAGERFGLIRFGSRVDLYLPLTARIAVKVGEKVRAGETALGFLSAPTEDNREEPVA